MRPQTITNIMTVSYVCCRAFFFSTSGSTRSLGIRIIFFPYTTEGRNVGILSFGSLLQKQDDLHFSCLLNAPINDIRSKLLIVVGGEKVIRFSTRWMNYLRCNTKNFLWNRWINWIYPPKYKEIIYECTGWTESLVTYYLLQICRKKKINNLRRRKKMGNLEESSNSLIRVAKGVLLLRPAPTRSSNSVKKKK